METIVVKNIDVELLKSQRDALLVVAEMVSLHPDRRNSIEGLVNMLDEMLDNSSDNPNNEAPIKILVKVDGGIVQDVIQNIGENVDVTVIDGDIEGADEEKLIEFEDKEYYIYEGDVNVFSPKILFERK